MVASWKHRRGVFYASLVPLPLIALLRFFWNVGWTWSLVVPLSLGLLFAWLRHRHPAFLVALGGASQYTSEQEMARGHSGMPLSGTGP